MDIFAQLTGPMGGMFGLGAGVGGGAVFTAFRMGWISVGSGVQLKADLASALTELKALRAEVAELKKELEPWRDTKEKMALALLEGKG